jgi:hypothetical protein
MDAASKNPAQPLLFANVSVGQNRTDSTRSRVAKDKAPVILTTFQIQLDGTFVRLTDSDGSTYVGHIEPVQIVLKGNTNGFAMTMPATPVSDTAGTGDGANYKSSGVAAAVSNSGVTAGASNSYASPMQAPTLQQSFAFTVTGTNATLKQAVVIRGNYIVTQPQMAIASKMMHQSSHMENTDASRGAKIQGEATVGPADSSQKIEINAVTLDVLKARAAP